jgi:hypothetical protein
MATRRHPYLTIARNVTATLVVSLTALTGSGGVAAADGGPAPGTPAYKQRDARNQQDAWGRIFGPGGQLRNPAYLTALAAQVGPKTLADWADQARRLNRPSVTLGMIFPPSNIGNPLRDGWSGRRGRAVPISYTNRYGALIKGTVYAPRPGARDPYTGKKLSGPFPGVVITTGSIQGTERMYAWLAEDLAERGYIVMTYDVQGQGRSETFPHQGPVADLPFCDPTAKPLPGEQSGCPGVISQQGANFLYGTQDALSFFQSSPSGPWRNPGAGSAKVNAYNPLWKLYDRRPDRRTVTPGRTSRIAVIGHSYGAAAVSYVQGVDPRVQTVVALDKLSSRSDPAWPVPRPVVPALGLQADYGFLPSAYDSCQGCSPDKAPDPYRERRSGFDTWAAAGVDSMVVVPRAATHLDYTDVPLVLPASRYGQALSSAYVQAWLAKYLKHDPTADKALLASTLHYLEPVAVGKWAPVTLKRHDSLSFYYCSAYRFRTSAGALAASPDITKVGCNK